MPGHNEFQISLNQNNIEEVEVTKINCNHNYGRARGGPGMLIRVNLNFNNTTSQKYLNDFPSILTKGSIMTPLIKMCHAFVNIKRNVAWTNKTDQAYSKA